MARTPDIHPIFSGRGAVRRRRVHRMTLPEDLRTANREISNVEVRISKDVEWPGAALRHSSFGVLRFCGSPLVLQAIGMAQGSAIR